MIYTLENDAAVLKIDTKAAEIASFRRKDKDIEYMWNGDPAYWSNRNPVLFPHIGSPKDKILNFKGEDHRVNNHGVCRSSEFILKEQGDDHVVMYLQDNEETYGQFPYHFLLEVRYTLRDSEVFIDYAIHNEEEDRLYFGFGLHPAFNCPLVPDRKFSDYRVEFNREDVPGSVLDLSYELFEKYPTYIIKEPLSRTYTLTDGENGVIMKTSDAFRVFALWTPMAPFVCLEPWINPLDYDQDQKAFEKMEGNLVLERGETYRVSYSFMIV